MAKRNNLLDLQKISADVQPEKKPAKVEPVKKVAPKKVPAKKEPEEQKTIDEYYTVKGAAELLHVTTRTIYTHIASGELEVVKAGKRTLIPKSSILSFIS